MKKTTDEDVYKGFGEMLRGIKNPKSKYTMLDKLLELFFKHAVEAGGFHYKNKFYRVIPLEDLKERAEL